MNQFNGLDDSIKAMAKRAKLPRFEIRDQAPQTFEEVLKTFKESNSLVIWSGGSESTIYRDPQVNYLFRAVHDFCHVQLNSNFTLAGETRTALHQMSQVGTELAKLIQIEVIGQAQCFFETGDFPADQVRFTLEQLKNENNFKKVLKF